MAANNSIITFGRSSLCLLYSEILKNGLPSPFPTLLLSLRSLCLPVLVFISSTFFLASSDFFSIFWILYSLFVTFAEISLVFHPYYESVPSSHCGFLPLPWIDWNIICISFRNVFIFSCCSITSIDLWLDGLKAANVGVEDAFFPILVKFRTLVIFISNIKYIKERKNNNPRQPSKTKYSKYPNTRSAQESSSLSHQASSICNPQSQSIRNTEKRLLKVNNYVLVCW